MVIIQFHSHHCFKITKTQTICMRNCFRLRNQAKKSLSLPVAVIATISGLHNTHIMELWIHFMSKWKKKRASPRKKKKMVWTTCELHVFIKAIIPSLRIVPWLREYGKQCSMHSSLLMNLRSTLFHSSPKESLQVSQWYHTQNTSIAQFPFLFWKKKPVEQFSEYHSKFGAWALRYACTIAVT